MISIRIPEMSLEHDRSIACGMYVRNRLATSPTLCLPGAPDCLWVKILFLRVNGNICR